MLKQKYSIFSCRWEAGAHILIVQTVINIETNNVVFFEVIDVPALLTALGYREIYLKKTANGKFCTKIILLNVWKNPLPMCKKHISFYILSPAVF